MVEMVRLPGRKMFLVIFIRINVGLKKNFSVLETATVAAGEPKQTVICL